MEIRNVTESQLEAALYKINSDTYEGKIKFTEGVRVIHQRKNGNQNVRVALRCTESKIPGSRDSWSGRSGPWACWHTFRDFYRALFAVAPDAVVVSSFAKFTADNFEGSYRETYYKNAGSMMQPVAFGELCHDCSDGCS